eukprot:15096924-Alexandrium_andersonii.AAC.1
MASSGRPGPQGVCAGEGPRPTCRQPRPWHGWRPPRPALRLAPSGAQSAAVQDGPLSVGPG